jgi:hypothetical protein
MRRGYPWLGVLLLLGGCISPRSEPTRLEAGSIESQLRPSQEIEANFTARQRLRFRFADRAGSMDAVLQVHCGEVVIVALTPFGTRLFSVRQRGLDVEVEPAVDKSWPISPLRVLLDVQRSFLYPLASPPPPDGTHSSRVGSVKLREEWRDGQLVERSLTESRGGRSGPFVVRYEPGMRRGMLPQHTELSSELHGYALEIETQSYSASSCAK